MSYKPRRDTSRIADSCCFNAHIQARTCIDAGVESPLVGNPKTKRALRPSLGGGAGHRLRSESESDNGAAIKSNAHQGARGVTVVGVNLIEEGIWIVSVRRSVFECDISDEQYLPPRMACTSWRVVGKRSKVRERFDGSQPSALEVMAVKRKAEHIQCPVEAAPIEIRLCRSNPLAAVRVVNTGGRRVAKQAESKCRPPLNVALDFGTDHLLPAFVQAVRNGNYEPKIFIVSRLLGVVLVARRYRDEIAAQVRAVQSILSLWKKAGRGACSLEVSAASHM